MAMIWRLHLRRICGRGLLSTSVSSLFLSFSTLVFLSPFSTGVTAELTKTAQAQEQDALSDADFESDDELDEPAEDSEDEDERPAKKQRSE